MEVPKLLLHNDYCVVVSVISGVVASPEMREGVEMIHWLERPLIYLDPLIRETREK
jgi:hypothetical protein